MFISTALDSLRKGLTRASGFTLPLRDFTSISFLTDMIPFSKYIHISCIRVGTLASPSGFICLVPANLLLTICPFQS
jgi:hypothetical protein